jgi:membrane protein implicated in regulation of membrane protease activity
VSRRDTIILRSAAAWTLFIWATRIRNILGDETRATSFKVVHTVLAVVSVVFAVAIWRVASRSSRRSRDRVDTSS